MDDDSVIYDMHTHVCLDGKREQTYPFHARGETGTSTATKTGSLDLRDDPVVSLHDNLLCFVPVAILHRALQVCAVVAVQVGEDTVLILESALPVDRWCILDGGQSSCRLCGCQLGSGRDGRWSRDAVRCRGEGLRRSLSRRHGVYNCCDTTCKRDKKGGGEVD